MFFTETDVAASLICQDLGIASSIRIEAMAVQDTEVGVRVTGKNTAIKPIALPKAKAKGKAKAKAAATTNFDFMELLLTSAAPPGAQAATARPSAGLTAATPSPSSELPPPASASAPSANATSEIPAAASEPGLTDDDLFGWARMVMDPAELALALEAVGELRDREDLIAEQDEAVAAAAQDDGAAVAVDEAAAAAPIAAGEAADAYAEDEGGPPGSSAGLPDIYSPHGQGEEQHATLIEIPGPGEGPPPPRPPIHTVRPPPEVAPGVPDYLQEHVRYQRTGAKSGIYANLHEKREAYEVRLGCLHIVRAGAVRATCSRHRDCKCWLSHTGRTQ